MTSNTKSKNETKIIAEPGKQEITIIREFDAPRSWCSGPTPNRTCTCAGWARAAMR